MSLFVWHFRCQLVSIVGISRARHTVFAEECVVNQRRVTVGHLGVDGKLGVLHILSVKYVCLSVPHLRTLVWGSHCGLVYF